MADNFLNNNNYYNKGGLNSQPKGSRPEPPKGQSPSGEKIIIDSISVSGCKYELDEYCTINFEKSNIGMFDFKHCEDCPNCYYKQLKHKEQECKELKEQLSVAQERYTTIRPHAIELADTKLKLQQEVNTLKQALDEIEEIAKHNNFLVRDPFCGTGYRDLSGQILNIINKERNRNE